MAQARQSLRVAAERVAPLLDRLTPQQVAHMEKRFAEDNRKFAREYLRGSEAERRKRRAKRSKKGWRTGWGTCRRCRWKK